MEIAFIISIVLLIAYSLLALFDGVFLHLYKYRLYEHKESKFEHLTHTVRAILFTGILVSLFINIENNSLFLFGSILLVADIITLIVDAYAEKDSRQFMGGLPRGEYIIHLLVNGFHFAAIAVFIVAKVQLTEDGLVLTDNINHAPSHPTFIWLVKNLIPGAIFMAALHVLVAIPRTAVYWHLIRNKITCC